jgi:hypothetical protein
MSVTDDAVLQSIERIILNPDVVLDATQRALAALSNDATTDRRATLERELKDTETELARLSAAIATGGPIDTLVTAIRARESTRQGLQSALRDVAAVPKLNPNVVRQEVEAHCRLARSPSPAARPGSTDPASIDRRSRHIHAA